MRSSNFIQSFSPAFPGWAFVCMAFSMLSSSSYADSVHNETSVTQSLSLLSTEQISSDRSPFAYQNHSNAPVYTEASQELFEQTIFEYQPEQSLVMADQEWQGLDTETYYEREQFVAQFLIERTRLDDIESTSRLDLLAELESMALYFAKHEQAYQLIKRLAKSSLRLRYSAGSFRTQVKGSRIQVHSATIFYDPMVSALVGKTGYYASGSSVMSAADALLHELLHAEKALNNSKDFIASGAMRGVGYPIEHERQVIALERELFASMTAQDGIERPQRHQHAGTLASALCSTCLR